MGDLIRRQAVLDVIERIADDVIEGDGFIYGKWKSYVIEMPSASGLIYRADAIKNLLSRCKENEYKSITAKDVIEVLTNMEEAE